MTEEKEAFLSRWSRRKHEAEVAPTYPEPSTEPALPQVADAGPVAAEAPPTLPPIESITVDTDLTPYFEGKVDQGLKRLALKKLFQDPHFHFASMDKLDIYIDDYSIADPLPEGMLEQLKFAQDYLLKDPTKAEMPAEGIEEIAPPPPAASEIAVESGPNEPAEEQRADTKMSQPAQNEEALPSNSST